MKSLPIRNHKNAKNKTNLKPVGPSINLDDVDVSNFAIDRRISKLANESFKIDKTAKFVLRNIAKDGPQNEKQIYREDHLRDSVRHRLNARNDNSKGLIKRGFLVKKQGEKTGNLPNKYENIYHLTLKGFMASLAEVKFDDNYLIKRYEQFISTKTSNPILAKFALLLIKYDVTLFLFNTMLEAVDLAMLDDLDSKIFEMNNGPLMDPTHPHKIGDPEHSTILSKTRFWFHVYSQVFNKLTEKSSGGHKFKIVKQIEGRSANAKHTPAFFVVSDLPKLVKSWYYYLPRLQYEDLDSFDPDVHDYLPTLQNLRGIDIDVQSVNTLSMDVLRKYGVSSNFSLSELPKFF